MAKHRGEDRSKGITGETDPKKVQSEYERIKRENEREMERIRRERGKK